MSKCFMGLALLFLMFMEKIFNSKLNPSPSSVKSTSGLNPDAFFVFKRQNPVKPVQKYSFFPFKKKLFIFFFAKNVEGVKLRSFGEGQSLR